MPNYTVHALYNMFPEGKRVSTNVLRFDIIGTVVGYSTNEMGNNIVVVKQDCGTRIGVHPDNLHIVRADEEVQHIRMDWAIAQRS